MLKKSGARIICVYSFVIVASFIVILWPQHSAIVSVIVMTSLFSLNLYYPLINTHCRQFCKVHSRKNIFFILRFKVGIQLTQLTGSVYGMGGLQCLYTVSHVDRSITRLTTMSFSLNGSIFNSLFLDMPRNKLSLILVVTTRINWFMFFFRGFQIQCFWNLPSYYQRNILLKNGFSTLSSVSFRLKLNNDSFYMSIFIEIYEHGLSTQPGF